MKLRYYAQENRITREQVEQYAEANQLNKMHAKDLLQNKSGYSLQYWDGHLEQWINVPYVTEFRE